jgi:hypothetical protein
MVTVAAPEALGAVSLEVVGPGVLGFEGMGSTEAYGGAVSAREGRHRLVVVDPTGDGELRFGIQVQDVSAPWPTLTVVSAAGTDDLERMSAGIEVSVARE